MKRLIILLYLVSCLIAGITIAFLVDDTIAPIKNNTSYYSSFIDTACLSCGTCGDGLCDASEICSCVADCDPSLCGDGVVGTGEFAWCEYGEEE